MKVKNTFTQKEIAEAINNAVMRSLRPAALGEATDTELRKYRAYAFGMIAPCVEHVEEGLLRYERLVSILLTAALFIQMDKVLHSDKLPAAPTVGAVFDEARKDLAEFERKYEDEKRKRK